MSKYTNIVREVNVIRHECPNEDCGVVFAVIGFWEDGYGDVTNIMYGQRLDRSGDAGYCPYCGTIMIEE